MYVLESDDVLTFNKPIRNVLYESDHLDTFALKEPVSLERR